MVELAAPRSSHGRVEIQTQGPNPLLYKLYWICTAKANKLTSCFLHMALQQGRSGLPMMRPALPLEISCLKSQFTEIWGRSAPPILPLHRVLITMCLVITW